MNDLFGLESIPPIDRAEEIYRAYPRKVGRQAALTHIRAALKVAPFDRLLERTKAFAEAVSKWPASERCYVLYPERWFKRGHYDDDPAEWERGVRVPEDGAAF